MSDHSKEKLKKILIKLFRSAAKIPNVKNPVKTVSRRTVSLKIVTIYLPFETVDAAASTPKN